MTTSMEKSKFKSSKTSAKTKTSSFTFRDSEQDFFYTKESLINTPHGENNNISFSIWNFIKDIFLPKGFPDSVHQDYVPYQIWDTVQASASTILGTLTTHSIMKGVGVGESSATPLAAAITWILKDGTGMIGRILFAWWNGADLDAQCKKWRLFADVLNDLAMGIELCLPFFLGYSTPLLCVSSGMRSLVGVAGGATRSSITQHQALKNNLADVSAKDGSQETCVNLLASLIGVFMLSYLNASSYVGYWFVVLAFIHIYANYRAVKSLCFDIFNEDRLAISIKNYLSKGTVETPERVNDQESVLLFARSTVKNLCGFDIIIGESIEQCDKYSKEEIIIETDLKASIVASKPFTLDASEKHRNIILPDVKNQKIYIALYQGVKNVEILETYFRAVLVGIYYTLHFNLQRDIKKEAQTSHGPLSKMYNMAQALAFETTNLDDLHIFIQTESTKWIKLVKNSHWSDETNLLPIGPYRLFESSTVRFLPKCE